MLKITAILLKFSFKKKQGKNSQIRYCENCSEQVGTGKINFQENHRKINKITYIKNQQNSVEIQHFF